MQSISRWMFEYLGLTFVGVTKKTEAIDIKQYKFFTMLHKFLLSPPMLRHTNNRHWEDFENCMCLKYGVDRNVLDLIRFFFCCRFFCHFHWTVPIGTAGQKPVIVPRGNNQTENARKYLEKDCRFVFVQFHKYKIYMYMYDSTYYLTLVFFLYSHINDFCLLFLCLKWFV